MPGDGLHRAAEFEAAFGLEFADQRPACIGLERARGCPPLRGELVDALADRVGAERGEGFGSHWRLAGAHELRDRLLHAEEEAQVGVEAQGGDVAPARIADADRGALDRAAIGVAVGVVRQDLRKLGVGDPGQAEFGGGGPDFAAGLVVVDGQDGVLGVEQVMHHDLAKRRQGFAQAAGDVLDLFEEQVLFSGGAWH